MEEENASSTEHFYGLLDKIQMLKEGGSKKQLFYKCAIIRMSNDEAITRLTNCLLGSSDNIGLRRAIKIIESEQTIQSIEVMSYNYIMSKKFKYLKEEAISSSDYLIIIINIFDKHCLENLKAFIEEYSVDQEVANKPTEERDLDYESPQISTIVNKKLRIVLIKSTNNFLLKLTENTAMATMKKNVEEVLSKVKECSMKYFEWDIDEMRETNNLFNELLN